MDDIGISNLEITSTSVVINVAKQFAETLGDTPQFKEFEQSYREYRKDTKAQQAIEEFQKKQASLKALLILNAVSEEDRKELQRLQDLFYEQPSVIRYTNAQEDLIVVCQQIGDILSKAIGLDYGASCKTGGCCG